MGLQFAYFALQFSDLRLQFTDLLHCGGGAELLQFCFQAVDGGRHVRHVHLDLLHFRPELFLLFAQSFLLAPELDRKSTRLNSSHPSISYAVFCLKKKTLARTSGSIPALIL